MPNLEEYNKKVRAIESKLAETTEFEDRMDLMGDIHDLKIQYGLVTINDNNDPIECIGCGS